MGKTITISDDVYMDLVRLKGNKSFSEIIRSLMKKESNIEVLLVGFGTRNEKETEELRKELEDAKKWMQSLIQV